MCGIVGIYLKNRELEPQLGRMFAPMLICMGDRGQDSTGLAIYGDEVGPDRNKFTCQHPDPDHDWAGLVDAMGKRFNSDTHLLVNATYAVIKIAAPPEVEADARAWLAEHHPRVRVMSVGRSIEILKEVGSPQAIVDRFNIPGMKGTHVIGHTRMATESAVTTDGSHPFSTGRDLCLVHNGSLSNHNDVRRKLIRHGIAFHTDNDSEVAAGYLMWRLMEGDDLEAALRRAMEDLDGFYTFAVGTRGGFAVLRDPIACKPAVMAETDDYVAIASEYRSLADLPGVDKARLWEPEPATVYVWGDN